MFRWRIAGLLLATCLHCSSDNDCSRADSTCALSALIPYLPFYVPRFLYSGNNTSNTISGYRIDPGTGALAALGNTATLSVLNLKISPDGRFLYIATGGGNSIVTFAIHPYTGALTQIGSVAATAPVDLLLDSSRRFAYVLNTLPASLQTFAIDPASGALSPSSTLTMGSAGNQMAWRPDQRAIYVANATGQVMVFRVDPASGAALLLSQTGLANARGVSADPFGRYVYVTDNTAILKVFQVLGDESLTLVSNATTGTFNTFSSVTPDGKYVYVSNQTTDNISVLQVGDGGVLTNVANQPAGTGPIGVHCDVNGRFLFVANSGSGDTYSFRINPSSGLLTLVSSLPSGVTAQTLGTLNQIGF